MTISDAIKINSFVYLLISFNSHLLFTFPSQNLRSRGAEMWSPVVLGFPGLQSFLEHETFSVKTVKVQGKWGCWSPFTGIRSV